MAATPVNAEQLKNAFEVFNQQSGLLEQSYRELKATVDSLTQQLSRARSARLAEFVRTERLSQHLTHLLDTLPGAIVVIDGAGRIRECNSDAMDLLNQPLIGCAWSDIVRREVREGGSEDGNLQLKDGRWLSLSRRPLKNEDGEVLLLANVTESHEMSVLRQRQERLTAIGEMTAEFAHQVRTPLASAILYAGQLDRTTPAQQRTAARIAERLQDLSRMVDDMLGFAAGGKRAEDDINVAGMLREVEQAIRPQLASTTTLRLSIDDADVMVAANKDALKGALLNLVKNAEQACGDHAAITLSLASCDQTVEIAVTDNGPGIAEEVLPRLFEPFFTTRPQGTGLGLAVVRAVVAAHGGDIDVDTSRYGASFRIRLPACNAPTTEAANA